MFKELPFDTKCSHGERQKSCLLTARMLQRTELGREAENKTPQPWCHHEHKKTLAVLRLQIKPGAQLGGKM